MLIHLMESGSIALSINILSGKEANLVCNMKKNSVYIDTTIPSYYYEERTDPIICARHLITVSWWDTQREKYDLFVSEFVLAELIEGEYPNKELVIDLVKDAAPVVLSLTNDLTETVEAFIEHTLMPKRDVADAYHLAFAAHYKVDYLLTWNCNHLANANKQKHIARILTQLRLFIPAIVTPEMLFQEEDEDEKSNSYDN